MLRPFWAGFQTIQDYRSSEENAPSAARVDTASMSGAKVRSSLTMGDLARTATRYLVKMEVKGLTGVVASNAMEAGLGALWGEDPRYPRATGQPVKKRIGQVIKMTFLAQDRNGRNMPAYARYAANAGSNFLANTWRERSEADTEHAMGRIGLGFVAGAAPKAAVKPPTVISKNPTQPIDFISRNLHRQMLIDTPHGDI